MRTTMKQLILSSLLLSTALLATGSAYATPRNFPHVATSVPWQTEIAVINTGNLPVTGTLRGVSDAGLDVETIPVTLSAQGRRQIIVANEFINHGNIGYIVFDTSSDAVQGYTKFYIEGAYRAAIPAVKEVNTLDINITHIASDSEWWTGLSLVNTTSAAKVLTITFSNGQSRPITLAANAHQALDIAQAFFSGQPQPGIASAVLTNASGVVGLELFGTTNNKQLDGILLTDKTALTLYYPHVAGGEWWTGIVAYNPSASMCMVTITPYRIDGTALTSSIFSIAGKAKLIDTVTGLGLPADAAWFVINSTLPLSGFELFGTFDGNLLAPYAGSGGAGAKAGVFAKIEKNGWTGIVFVNTEASAASVTLTGYNDDGTSVAWLVLDVGGHAKVVNVTENMPFVGDISSATYIGYSSDKNVVGFQLNASSDNIMLDGLPGLAVGSGPSTPEKIAFVVGSGTSDQIFIMNTDGTGVTQLTNATGFNDQPKFNRQGTRIVFTSSRDGHNQIYIMNSDGSGQTRLTTTYTAKDSDPSFSPDGTKIVFKSDRDDPNREIYIMDVNGGNVTRLTNNTANDADPVFSPDGTKIAFDTTRDGNWQIYTMDLSGGSLTRLTNSTFIDDRPVYSPDGTKILFSTRRDGGSLHLYTMNADGSNPTRLTNTSKNDDWAQYSPDGSKIVFVRSFASEYRIWTISADGSNPTALTDIMAESYDPSWGAAH